MSEVEKQVWFVTGAGRGLGTDIAKAALEAGHAVVATGRNPESVKEAVGESEDLLVVKLDITNSDDISGAIEASTERFGKIDVLVNNAANFNAGFFEELSPEEVDNQLATTLIGAMAVTRAVLPVMRERRSGHIIAISSIAGLAGFPFNSAYAASKFGLEGFMQALHAEVEPFGIDTTVVNPGFFRTELLTEESTHYADNPIEDYNEARTQQVEFYKSQNGKQPGDPEKLAKAIIKIASDVKPPVRFIAGADAVAGTEQVIATLQQQLDTYRELSLSLAHDDTQERQL